MTRAILAASLLLLQGDSPAAISLRGVAPAAKRRCAPAKHSLLQAGEVFYDGFSRMGCEVDASPANVRVSFKEHACGNVSSCRLVTLPMEPRQPPFPLSALRKVMARMWAMRARIRPCHFREQCGVSGTRGRQPLLAFCRGLVARRSPTARSPICRPPLSLAYPLQAVRFPARSCRVRRSTAPPPVALADPSAPCAPSASCAPSPLPPCPLPPLPPLLPLPLLLPGLILHMFSDRRQRQGSRHRGASHAHTVDCFDRGAKALFAFLVCAPSSTMGWSAACWRCRAAAFGVHIV